MKKSKDEENIISLPCPVKHCMWNGMVKFEFGLSKGSETNKRYLLQRTLNELLAGHQDGKHTHAQCCCCHHQCTCEHLACKGASS
jgi:hypothetical protein